MKLMSSTGELKENYLSIECLVSLSTSNQVVVYINLREKTSCSIYISNDINMCEYKCKLEFNYYDLWKKIRLFYRDVT